MNVECPMKGLGLCLSSTAQGHISFDIEISTYVPDVNCTLTRSAHFSTSVTPETLSSHKKNTLLFASKDDSRFQELRKSYCEPPFAESKIDQLTYQQVVNKW